MQEIIILTILILICSGQVWAIFRGRLIAAIYYLYVAPLGYFTVWQFGSWGPDRLCGLILILGGLFKFGRVPGIPRFSRHPLLFFLAFLFFITLIGSFFWPIDAMAGKSEVYGSLRGAIQFIKWLIWAGAAWQVGIALSLPGNFEKARYFIVFMGVIHSAYAIYQMFAYSAGLPATGIRRAYSGVSFESGGEQFAAFNVAGQNVYRPGSLIGEPKHLGAISLVWISTILTFFIKGKVKFKFKLALFISLVALFFTFSTSAWYGFVFMLALAMLGFRKNFSKFFVKIVFGAVFLSAILGLCNLSGVFPDGLGFLTLVENRTVMREYFDDLPEVEAQRVLENHPEMIFFGTGLGGISFYIAENLKGSDIILFPNAGLLAYLCDMGFIGIFLLFFCLWKGLRIAFKSKLKVDSSTKYLSFIGAVCLLQTFIFDAGITIFALAFLLAADFRHRQQTVVQREIFKI